MKQYINKIIHGDSLEVLKKFPDESVNMVITSPPYWALRDYGIDGQIGQENNFTDYISKLCDLFIEIRRVIVKDGTCWVNLGDTYMNNSSYSSRGRQGYEKKEGMIYKKNNGITTKSLCLIPERFAIEMVNRGWTLRNQIIWHKPNCMPSSVNDRFTVDYEKLFFFSKSKNYSFEKQFEPHKSPQGKPRDKNTEKYKSLPGQFSVGKRTFYSESGRNKRCVWTIPVRPFKDAHFAVYPPELIETPIKAGCPENGIVLDPFMGSGTTALVALQNNRKFIGIELNPEYIKIAKRRIRPHIEQEKLTDIM